MIKTKCEYRHMEDFNNPPSSLTFSRIYLVSVPTSEDLNVVSPQKQVKSDVCEYQDTVSPAHRHQTLPNHQHRFNESEKQICSTPRCPALRHLINKHSDSSSSLTFCFCFSLHQRERRFHTGPARPRVLFCWQETR